MTIMYDIILVHDDYFSFSNIDYFVNFDDILLPPLEKKMGINYHVYFGTIVVILPHNLSLSLIPVTLNIVIIIITSIILQLDNLFKYYLILFNFYNVFYYLFHSQMYHNLNHVFLSMTINPLDFVTFTFKSFLSVYK